MKETHAAGIGLAIGVSGVGNIFGEMISTVEDRANKCSDGFVKDRRRFSSVGDILEFTMKGRINNPDVFMVVGCAV